MLPPFPNRLFAGALLGACVLVCACEAPVDTTGEEVEPYRKALPTIEAVSVELPGLVTEGGEVVLPGDEERGAETYRSAAYMVARMHLTLRQVVEPIAALPDQLQSREVHDRVIVWSGRREGDDHDLELVVERRDEATFGFVLFVSVPVGGEQTWRPIAFGQHTAGSGAGEGRGSMAVDLQLDGRQDTSGNMLVNWSALRGHKTVTLFLFDHKVPAHFAPLFSPGGEDGRKHDGEEPDKDKPPKANAVYHYERRPDGAGALMYADSSAESLEGDKQHPLPEHVEGAVSWKASGAGRADVYTHGGSIEKAGLKQSVLSQCWRASDYVLVYEQRKTRSEGEPLKEVSSEGVADRCPEGLSKAQRPVLPEAGRPSSDAPMPWGERETPPDSRD
jgi:hypothetical protein